MTLFVFVYTELCRTAIRRDSISPARHSANKLIRIAAPYVAAPSPTTILKATNEQYYSVISRQYCLLILTVIKQRLSIESPLSGSSTIFVSAKKQVAPWV